MANPQESRPRPSRPASAGKSTRAAQDARLEELKALRAEVADLTRLVASHNGPAILTDRTNARDPWVKIAATVAVTFALGKIITALRLPPATAVAVPMITAEFTRRFL